MYLVLGKWVAYGEVRHRSRERKQKSFTVLLYLHFDPTTQDHSERSTRIAHEKIGKVETVGKSLSCGFPRN